MKTQSFLVFVKKLSGGRLKLWQAFWLVFAPTPIILYAIYSLFLFLLGQILGSDITFTQLKVVVVLYSTIAITLMILLGLWVWKCAFNTHNVLWGYLSRFVVTSYLIWYGLKVIIGWLILIKLMHL